MTTTLTASALAAPPPPSIPRLDRPLVPEALADGLRSFSTSYYANHPFHQLMHEGRLSPRQLQGWVANRLAYQRAIPRKDAAIISNCPEPERVSGSCTYTTSALGGGSHAITAVYGGDTNYSTSTSEALTQNVNQASQTITFDALPGKTYGDSSFAVSATASSGLTVSFTSTTTSICTATGTNGATVAIVGTGTCTIKASQGGNANYAAASDVERSS